MVQKHTKRIVHSIRHTWKHDKKAIFIGIAALILIFFGCIALWISTFKLPDLSSFNTIKVAQSTNIYDRTGTVLLYSIHQDQNRTVVPFDEISQYIKDATVAIEDPSFYSEEL